MFTRGPDGRLVVPANLLDDIVDDLVEQSRLVGIMIGQATRALLEADVDLAHRVIADDARVDAIHSAVSEKTLLHVSTHSSAATDLRIAMSAMLMSASLERMGDLAAHVAKTARMRHPRPAVPAELAPTFERAGTVCRSVAACIGDAIAQRDVALAQEAFAIDDELDLIHRALFVIVLAPTWSHGIETAVDVTLLSRFYERFGDHAVSVGRRVVHVVTGESYSGVLATPDS